jgi:hypothetical protein
MNSWLEGLIQLPDAGMTIEGWWQNSLSPFQKRTEKECRTAHVCIMEHTVDAFPEPRSTRRSSLQCLHVGRTALQGQSDRGHRKPTNARPGGTP